MVEPVDLNQDVQELRGSFGQRRGCRKGSPWEVRGGSAGTRRSPPRVCANGSKIAPFFTPTKIRLGSLEAKPSLFKELLQCKHHGAAQHETLLGKSKAKSLIFSRTQSTRDIGSSARTFLTVWAYI